MERNPLLKVIYYQSVDALTMQEVAAWSDSERIQGCIAVPVSYTHLEFRTQHLGIAGECFHDERTAGVVFHLEHRCV